MLLSTIGQSRNPRDSANSENPQINTKIQQNHHSHLALLLTGKPIKTKCNVAMFANCIIMLYKTPLINNRTLWQTINANIHI